MTTDGKPSEADSAMGFQVEARHWPSRAATSGLLRDDIARAIHNARQEERTRFRALVVLLDSRYADAQLDIDDPAVRHDLQERRKAFTALLRGLEDA